MRWGGQSSGDPRIWKWYVPQSCHTFTAQVVFFCCIFWYSTFSSFLHICIAYWCCKSLGMFMSVADSGWIQQCSDFIIGNLGQDEVKFINGWRRTKWQVVEYIHSFFRCRLSLFLKSWQSLFFKSYVTRYACCHALRYKPVIPLVISVLAILHPRSCAPRCVNR